MELADGFWAPRQLQLRDHTLPVMLERLERAGAVDAFRRLGPEPTTGERRGLWFSDSDLFKWMEAAARAGRLDLLDPIIELIPRAQHLDGYLHSFYDAGPGSQARYSDLTSSHELYCGGHFVEAALAHHAATGETVLLDIAHRWADHVCATFGPGRDERTDGHPEVELALARLASATGEARYLEHARWTIEAQLANVGQSVDDVDLAGHTVKALYLASGIAEVARATNDERWRAAATRLFTSLVDEHAYPTGAVGGRWLDESVGRPFELPDAMAYAESCAAVASVQFARRVWELTGEPRALDHVELLLYNAVPCGVGADGESWFYCQPHAVPEDARESNPWVAPFEYGPSMLLSWSPPRRHRWFDVACCPTNLARLFATVPDHVADIDETGDLRIHLPLAARIRGDSWDVEITGAYPDDGAGRVRVHAAPAGRVVRVRIPGWAGGDGHRELGPDGRVDLPVADEWWETDRRVEGAAGTVYLRRGPVVRCVEGIDTPGVDLRRIVVDPARATAEAFARVPATGDRLHRRATVEPPVLEPLPDLRTVAYHAWANRGPTPMRYRFPRR